MSVVGGFGAGFINPILGAVIYERIPDALVGRVITLTSALSWAGMPFGGLVARLLVSGYGEVAALLAVGAAYTVATMSPLLVPSFRRFDERPAPRYGAAGTHVTASARRPGVPQPRPGNQSAISRAADSSESEPWTRFSRFESE